MSREVFDGFEVVIKDARGDRRGTLTPEQFRAAMGGGRTEFLGTLVERYNARQEAEGAEDRATLEMRTRSNRGRGRRR